jgi:hypothetical protein
VRPFYASPCSAVSRWWRIALAPGFAGPLCCIASIQHARSHDTRGFRSLSLSQTRACCGHRMHVCVSVCAGTVPSCGRVHTQLPWPRAHVVIPSQQAVHCGLWGSAAAVTSGATPTAGVRVGSAPSKGHYHVYVEQLRADVPVEDAWDTRLLVLLVDIVKPLLPWRGRPRSCMTASLCGGSAQTTSRSTKTRGRAPRCSRLVGCERPLTRVPATCNRKA